MTVSVKDEHSTALPDGPILVLTLISKDGKLHFHLEWKQQPTNEDENFTLASALDRIARHISRRFLRATEELDEAAIIGFKVRKLTPMKRRMLDRWFLREG